MHKNKVQTNTRLFVTMGTLNGAIMYLVLICKDINRQETINNCGRNGFGFAVKFKAFRENKNSKLTVNLKNLIQKKSY